MNQTKVQTLKGLALILIIFLVLIAIAGAYYFGTKKRNVLPAADWLSYTNDAHSFTLKYPDKLTLRETDNEIILNHNIPYKNSGDCDMTGGANEFSTLEDFSLTFSIVSNPDIPSYADTFRIGTLDGKVVLWGAEGCGDTYYYFKAPNNKTLFIKRANIQALSGISTAWDSEKILKVPGVIGKEENEKLFHQILSTIKFSQ